jgi:hypothetical protein
MFVFLLFVKFSYAVQSDTEITYKLMRDIAINERINDDYKIPKENRKKWEKSFSNYIDFESLNNTMRDSVKQALEKYSEGTIDDKKASYLAEKRVANFLPKILRGMTVGYLTVKRKIGELPKCRDNRKPTVEEKVLICTERSNDTIKAYMVAADTEERSYHYSFKKTDKWRLSELHYPIPKEIALDMMKEGK